MFRLCGAQMIGLDPLLANGASTALQIGATNGFRVRGARRRRLRLLRRLRRPFEEDLTMIVGILYAAAALGIGVYMLWALLTPEKF
jgi:hypothetical protein